MNCNFILVFSKKKCGEEKATDVGCLFVGCEYVMLPLVNK